MSEGSRNVEHEVLQWGTDKLRVSLDKAAYKKIIEIVRNENGVSYIVEILEKKRTDIVKEIQESEAKMRAEENNLIEVERPSMAMDSRYSHRIHYQEASFHVGSSTASPSINSYPAGSFPRDPSKPALRKDIQYNTLPFTKKHTVHHSLAEDSYSKNTRSPAMIKTK